ncbi:MAG TPA: tetratricopeptide repeat protein [Casimicrobiaceae bacterium]|nr:tetratricopeptide repeat protein [Casimicrobiaceae bacterium]
MPSVARNALCPCGSGKRYKACHGAGAAGEPAEAPETPERRIAPLLGAALEAQQQRRFDEARRLYADVLSAVPDHFDAMHMLGVVHYQLGELEVARRYLERARALRPQSPGLRNNLQLVTDAFRQNAIEREICREVLPRLRPLCATPDEATTWLRSAAAIHLVASPATLQAAQRVLESLRARCAPVPIRRWTDGARATGWDVLDGTAGELPRGGLLLVLAGPQTVSHWLDSAAAERTGMVVADDEPPFLIDRLGELSLQGRRRAAIFYTMPQLARTIGLPGVVVGEAVASEAA